LAIDCRPLPSYLGFRDVITSTGDRKMIMGVLLSLMPREGMLDWQ
jgi:hypothetical protein